MNKQTYINEVMEELKVLQIHDRYDRVRSNMSQIDAAFESNDTDKVYEILGTPKKYASKLAYADTVYDYKKVVSDVISDTMQNVEAVVKEAIESDTSSKPRFTKSKFERQVRQDIVDKQEVQNDDVLSEEIVEDTPEVEVIDSHDSVEQDNHTSEKNESNHTKKTHYYQKGQFDEPYYKKVNANKIFAIVLIIIAISMFSTPFSRVFLGIFGGIAILLFGMVKIIAFIFVIYLVIKVLGKPKQ